MSAANDQAHARHAAVTLYYSEDYAVAQHAFDTTRKARWIRESLAAEPIPGLECRAPEPVDAVKLRTVHDAGYIEAVRSGEPRTLACSQGFPWDPGIWHSACAHVGGLVAAARTALATGCAGSLSSGQHHAARASGAGFCTFNGLALAAMEALSAGARRVLILDLDAHCAGGTHALVEADAAVWQVDVAVNGYDSYTPGRRCSLDLVEDAADYLATVQHRLSALNTQGIVFDLCLYYAGMDPFQACETGGLDGIDRDLLAARERLVFEWCRQRRLPVAFGIGGGYAGGALTAAGVVALHRLTLAAAVSTNVAG